MKRRRFLDAVLGTGFASTLVAVAYPVWRYLIPPPSAEPATQSVVAGQVAELKNNTGLLFRFGNRPGLLIRTPDGEVQAFNAVCTHLQCTVRYKSDTSQIWCACHNGLFDLQGNVVSGPPPGPLERLRVDVRGADIIVSRT